jgi:hypothetical protein
MYDDKLRQVDYDRYNSLISQQNSKFYLLTSGLHTVSFMYLAYFFRYRRVSAVSTLLISSAYYYYFTKTNNIAYKLLVDKPVLNLAKELGHTRHIQPLGVHKNRGLNFWEILWRTNSVAWVILLILFRVCLSVMIISTQLLSDFMYTSPYMIKHIQFSSLLLLLMKLFHVMKIIGNLII